MEKKRNRKVSRKKASVVVVAYLVLMVTLVAGTTFALLMSKTENIMNEFTSAVVNGEIDEDLTSTEKKNVQIQNTGNIDVYVRTKVVVTWQDENGNVYGIAPVEGKDYEMDWCVDNASNLNQPWFEAKGYYYHKAAIKPDQATSYLFTSCKEGTKNPDIPSNYKLNVEIISTVIQAEGKDSSGNYAVEVVWPNVKVDTVNNVNVLTKKE